MAQGQIIEPNLIPGNVRNNIELFGVTGNYQQVSLTESVYFLGPPVVARDLGSFGVVEPSGAILFHDVGNKIVIMGESSLKITGGGSPNHGACVYYCELDKDTGVLSRIASFLHNLGTTTTYNMTKMVLVGGEYYWTRTNASNSVGYYKFDGNNILTNTSYRQILLDNSQVGSAFMSYNGKTLQQGGLYWEAHSTGTGRLNTSATNLMTMRYQ